jgi:hypothetical protein
MTIRPFKLINRTERGMLTGRLTEGIRRWSARYLSEDTRIDCGLVLPDEAPRAAHMPEPGEWILASRQSMPVLAIGLNEDWPRGLARAALTERQATSLDPAGQQLLRDVGAGLFEELGQSVLEGVWPTQPAEGGLAWSRPTAPPWAEGPHDGRVVGHCRVGNELELLISLCPQTVQRCLALDAPRGAAAVGTLEPLSTALQSEMVVLEGIAGEAELALEELTTLAVGDVIRLNRKISEPLQVCVRGGGVVCAARLGASRGRTALQLT